MNIVNGLKVISKDLVALGHRQSAFCRAKPLTSTLFLTYRCNSKCKTCTMWLRPQDDEKKKEIGFEQWKVIIDQLADMGIRSTEIFGGNVLLRKELLIDVLAYLHECGIAIHLPTNQIGLDDQIAEDITRYVDTVYISTDSYGVRQNDIRGIKDASTHMEEAITKLKRARGSISPGASCPRLVCNTTVSKYNVNIMEEMVDYASSLEFDEIHFEYAGEFNKETVSLSTIDGLKPTPYYLKQDESILVDREGASNIKKNIKRIKLLHKNSNIVVRTINIDSLSEENLWRGTIPHKKCYVERNEVTVDPSGNLIICPFINNYKMGNLLSDSLDTLWGSEKQLVFRAVQNKGGLPMCQNCILGVQRNPGLMTSLKRIYLSRIEPALLRQ